MLWTLFDSTHVKTSTYSHKWPSLGSICPAAIDFDRPKWWWSSIWAVCPMHKSNNKWIGADLYCVASQTTNATICKNFRNCNNCFVCTSRNSTGKGYLVLHSALRTHSTIAAKSIERDVECPRAGQIFTQFIYYANEEVVVCDWELQCK